MKTKKIYMQPRARIINMGTEQTLMAGSVTSSSASFTAALFDYGKANSISFN